MERQLLSLPIVSDDLSIYSDQAKIAEILGITLEQETAPDNFFFHKGSLYKFESLDWGTYKKRFYVWEYGMALGFRTEQPEKEIAELKAANSSIAASYRKIETERNNAMLRLENMQSEYFEAEKERVSKDLFLQAISAATGKILK